MLGKVTNIEVNGNRVGDLPPRRSDVMGLISGMSSVEERMDSGVGSGSSRRLLGLPSKGMNVERESIMGYLKNTGDRSGWIQVPIGGCMEETKKEYVESRCKLEGNMYPGDEVDFMFRLYDEVLEVRESVVASWSGKGALGLYTKIKLRKGEIIGVYRGRRTTEEGDYVIDVTSKDRGKLWLDAVIEDGQITKFGRMNEDIHGTAYNCALGHNGLIIVLCDIEPGTELVTRYGDQYNWDVIKNEALAELRSAFNSMELGVSME